MRRPLSFLVAFTFAAGLFGAAEAATQCRDASGKFVKCPPAASSGTCRNATGKFVRCGTPGAMPASATQSKSAMASGVNTASKSKPSAKSMKPAKSTNTVGPAPK